MLRGRIDITEYLEKELEMFVMSNTQTFSQLKELVLKQEPIKEIQNKISDVVAQEHIEYAAKLNYNIFRKQLSNNIEKIQLTDQEKNALRAVLKHVNDSINVKEDIAVLEEQREQLRSKPLNISIQLEYINDRRLEDINPEYKKLYDKYRQLMGERHSMVITRSDFIKNKQSDTKSSAIAVALSAVATVATVVPIAILTLTIPAMFLIALCILCILSSAALIISIEYLIRTLSSNDAGIVASIKAMADKAGEISESMDELENKVEEELNAELQNIHTEIGNLTTQIEHATKKADELYQCACNIEPGTVMNGSPLFFTTLNTTSGTSEQHSSQDRSQKDELRPAFL